MRTAEHHKNAKTAEQSKRLLKQLASTKWAALLLRTWFITPATRQNPHFTYADVMKASVPMELRATVALVLALIVCAPLAGSEAALAWQGSDIGGTQPMGSHTWDGRTLTVIGAAPA